MEWNLSGGGKDGQMNLDDTRTASGQPSYDGDEPGYEAPTVDDLGSVADLTAQKGGSESDGLDARPSFS